MFPESPFYFSKGKLYYPTKLSKASFFVWGGHSDELLPTSSLPLLCFLTVVWVVFGNKYLSLVTSTILFLHI